jgi:hypothetical protein
MLLLQPGEHDGLQLADVGDELAGIGFGGVAGAVVLDDVPLLAAAVEVVGIAAVRLAEDMRQGSEGAGVRELALGRTVALGGEQNRAELERGVVGDAVAPVRRDGVGARVAQVALDDPSQIPDLLRTCPMSLEPARGQPCRQTPVRPR